MSEKELLETIKENLDYMKSTIERDTWFEINSEQSKEFYFAIVTVLTIKEEEIEELKEINEELVESIEEGVNGERINDINCISKDKIREKIKAFQNIRKEILKNDNELLRSSITYDIVRNDYCEKMLQELLEEG